MPFAEVEPHGERFAIYIDGILIAEGSSTQMATVAWAINESQKTLQAEALMAERNSVVSECLALLSDHMEEPTVVRLYENVEALLQGRLEDRRGHLPGSLKRNSAGVRANS